MNNSKKDLSVMKAWWRQNGHFNSKHLNKVLEAKKETCTQSDTK